MKMHKKTCKLVLAITASMACALQADSINTDETSVIAVDCPQSTCCESGSGRFFAAADLLYWKPHITGLELDFGTTSISEVITDGTEVVTTSEFDADPHFKWNAGYRVAAGYQFDCSNWEVGAIWTHFQDTGSRSIDEDAETVNTTRTRIKFNQIDVLLAYNDSLCSSFNVKPFVGIRGAKIHENLNALLVTDIVIAPTTPLTETRTFDDSQHYWGVGPILGLQGDWDMGCGLSLYGAVAASFLYGEYKLHFDDTDFFTAPISRDIFSTSKRHLRGIDCNIDLAIGFLWETCICDSYQLRMKLGFEHHQYFNHSHLGTSRGDLTFDGGVFSVGVAL